MDKEVNSIPNAKSNKGTWLIIAVVAICILMVCCLLIISGIFLIPKAWNNKTVVPESQTVSPVQTNPVVPPKPTATTSVDTSTTLDYEADPLFGSASLQRGFSPDPHTVAVGAGGTVDTSRLNLDCGFTTSSPTFTFKLSGGASEGFLRIFYATSDGTDTTLVVHTPDQKWICMDNSSYGNGTDPVIDIDYAASGEYAIWVGTHQSDTYGTGSLSITESSNTTP